MKTTLTDNNGFAWTHQQGVWVKGYAFSPQGKLLRATELCQWFDTSNIQQFEAALHDANGMFAVVVQKDNFCAAATDRSRTFALFYHIHNNQIHISDNVENFTTQGQIEAYQRTEFLSSAYVTGGYTLMQHIYTLQAGEYIVFDHEKVLQKQQYFQHYTHTTPSVSTEAATNQLISSIQQATQRLIHYLDGRPIALPLSGGFDSRLIAVMLHQAGYKNVFCFTYGRKGNSDAVLSEKVARKLGYDWLMVEYTPKVIDNYLHTDIFRQYVRYAAQYTSMPFLQEYFAVKYLQDNKLIPPNAVFLPGHSGDVLAGSHLRKNIGETANIEALAQHVFDVHYRVTPPPRWFAKAWKKQFLTNYGNLQHHHTYSLQQHFDLTNRHGLFIVNSARVYPFFGYAYGLPLWDNALVELFKAIPYPFKLYKTLYRNVLANHFFAPLGILFEHELQASQQTVQLQSLKEKIKPYLPVFLKSKYLQKNDWMCYYEATLPMITDMKNSNYPYNPNIGSYNGIIVQWYMSQL